MKDAWRESWGKRAGPSKFYQTSQIVPLKFEGVCDWARVVSKGVVIDKTRSRDVIYAGHGEEEDEIVVVRFQGFLGEKFNIGVCGTWNGCVYYVYFWECINLMEANVKENSIERLRPCSS